MLSAIEHSLMVSQNSLTFPEVVNFMLNVLTNSDVVNNDGKYIFF